MSEIKVEELNTLCEQMRKQKNLLDEMKDRLKAENALYDSLETKAIAYLEELGQDKFASPFGTISKKEEFYFTVPQEDNKMLFFDYLKEKGLFERYATIHATAFNSYCKAEFEAAKEAGTAMEFELPGVDQPKLLKKLSFRK